MNPSRDKKLRDAVNTSLLAYVKSVYPAYEIADHHRLIAKHLELVEAGVISRLIIEAPPRHGKTFLVSEFFPSWYMGKHPTHEIIYGTYAQSLASKVGRKVRNQLSSKDHSLLFPGCKISMDSKSKNEFATLQGGEYHALGIDGQATGKGANLVILDDTLKGMKQAESEVVKENIREFYRSSVYTRLYPGAGIIIMQTRWAFDDLIGYVLEEQGEEGWVVLKLPATDDEEITALWPSRYPIERLMKIKKALGPYAWNALYLQRPLPKKGSIFNSDWWKFYKELPERFDKIIQSWDMSFKEGENNSFVVCQIWGKKGANSYLIHQFRKQIGFTDTLRAFVDITNKFPKAMTKLVEAKANGPAIMDVIKNKIHGIIAVEPDGSKEARASAVSPIIESGCVYLPDPKEQSWVLEYIEEHTRFPKADYDDQVDCGTQALSHLYGTHTNRIEDLLRF